MMRCDRLPMSREREAAKAKIYQALCARPLEPIAILQMVADFDLLVIKDARQHQSDSLLISRLPADLFKNIAVHLQINALIALLKTCVYLHKALLANKDISAEIKKAKDSVMEVWLQKFLTPIPHKTLGELAQDVRCTRRDHLRFFAVRRLAQQLPTQMIERLEPSATKNTGLMS